jgi:hypothetical protein
MAYFFTVRYAEGAEQDVWAETREEIEQKQKNKSGGWIVRSLRLWQSRRSGKKSSGQA